jgi:hypothetical protein
MKSKLIIVLVFYIALSSCSKDVEIISGNKLLIGEKYFNDYPLGPVMISNAEINGDTLTITFSASCCSTNNWITNLVGSETVLYSSPPQRMIRLSFKGEVFACDMLCGKTVQFDISPAKLKGINILLLQLSGWESPLIYSY